MPGGLASSGRGTSLTLGQKEVGHERTLEGRLTELQPVWDLPQQQLHHDKKLVHLAECDIGTQWAGSPTGWKKRMKRGFDSVRCTGK